MRAVLLLPLCFLLACTGPKVTHIRYSPPSAVPVRRAVANAQDHAHQAKKDIADAQKTQDKDVLRLALADANDQIDQLTAELLNAQNAIADYEHKTNEQTGALNTCNDDKNTALHQRDVEKGKAATASRKLWGTRGLLLTALIWIFRVPLWGLVKLGLGLIKVPL